MYLLCHDDHDHAFESLINGSSRLCPSAPRLAVTLPFQRGRRLRMLNPQLSLEFDKHSMWYVLGSITIVKRIEFDFQLYN